MNYLPLLVTDSAFLIDNSRLERFTTCPRAAEYSVIQKIKGSGEKFAMDFGKACHLALALRYRSGSGPITPNLQLRQMWILEEFFKTHQPSITEYRNLGFAQQVIQAYNEEYQQEPFEVMSDKTNNYIVEQPFAVLLGKVNGINIIWTGRIDLPVYWDDSLWVFDHKTSSMGGDYLFQEYYNSSQMLGYTFALQRVMSKGVKGVCVNVLVCRKPTKTGKGIEFMRNRIAFDQSRVDEWQFDTLHIVEDFLRKAEKGILPMHTKFCVHKYGICEYMKVCTLSKEARPAILAGPEYMKDEWDPLHDTDLKLENFERNPLPIGFDPAKTVKQHADLAHSYLADLLN